MQNALTCVCPSSLVQRKHCDFTFPRKSPTNTFLMHITQEWYEIPRIQLHGMERRVHYMMVPNILTSEIYAECPFFTGTATYYIKFGNYSCFWRRRRRRRRRRRMEGDYGMARQFGRLEVLHCLGVWPQCSQAHMINLVISRSH